MQSLKCMGWLGVVMAITLMILAGLKLLGPHGGAEAQRAPTFVQQGRASWYGPGFHGQKTASGERFNQNQLSAAHRHLPLGTKATVTNLENGKSVNVVINDRGPYVGRRVIDLSKAAAERIEMKQDGVTRVRIEAER